MAVPAPSALGEGSAAWIDTARSELVFKRKLTTFVGSLPMGKIAELNRALAAALDLSWAAEFPGVPPRFKNPS